MTKPINLSLPALKQQYLDKQLTPRSLFTSLLEQAHTQADYNAWVQLLDMATLEPYFAYLDTLTPEDLPLYGVPFAIKDNIDLAHVDTTAGCEDFRYTPNDHAAVVATLIRAGAIPLGKTNLDQFATGLVGTRSPYGQGKNSFNPDYISGGSSAGSAIATALGQVSFALGTDTAGSGRVPAALNNLIGHKPSKGLLSTTGVVPACRTLDCVSIFSLTAADAASILDVAANYDKADPFARENSYSNRARYFSGKTPTRFTFAIPDSLEFHGNTECETLFHQAVEALSSLGGQAKIIDFSPFSQAAKLLYEGPWVAERWLATKDVDHTSMLPEIQSIIGSGNEAKASDAFAASYRLAELKRQCDALIHNVDIVLTPTTPTFYTRKEIDADPVRLNSVLGTYTNFMNLLDYCASAVPVGATSCGVHWGITLFSHAFKDIEVLNYAAALQQHFALPLGATNLPFTHMATSAAPTIKDSMDIAVCGAHLEGQPLNWQLTERGGQLVQRTHSSKHYALYALPDGKRPAMMRRKTEGACIEMEIWRLPKATLGSFVTGIPAPLGIGKVELKDGSWVSGFICDHYGLENAEDITAYGGWRAWLQNR